VAQLYHYTIGIKLDPIYATGALLPSPGEGRERGILWLSSNEGYEPSAAKAGASPGGQPRVLSLEEMMQHGGGVFRFVVDSDRPRLYEWPRLAERARLSRSVRGLLLRRAEECGAHPRQWFGSLAAIAVDALALQQRTPDGRWLDVRYEDVAQAARNPRVVSVRGSEAGVDIPRGQFRPTSTPSP